ncbi:MAG TPA: class I SAM-dependent methyltransferase [Gaiellaceae bacterium]
MNLEQLGRKFARLATNLVVRRPSLWRVLRPVMRLQFERLAPHWDAIRSEDAYAPYEAALERVKPAPRRALDLGTGTGEGAFVIARRFPEAQVTGVDLAPAMVAAASSKTPPELRERVRFEVADAAELPYDDRSFELVGLGNMIPFFDELERVLAGGGFVLFAFSGGTGTPIYVPAERLRSELGARGFTDFAEISAGSGTALLARKAERA